MSRRTALAAAALLAAAAGAWLATRPEPPSDEAQVRALVEAAARAAEERRAAEVVAGVSGRFRGEGLDRDGLRRMVAALTLRGAWVGVKLAGLQVAVDGDGAAAVADVVLARGGAGKALADLIPAEASAYRVDCRLEREAEGWRVVEASWRAVPLGEALAGAPPPARPRGWRGITGPRRSARRRRPS
jgi:hypothetical protein